MQNGYVRQGLKHTIGDTQFSEGQFNGKAFTDILANFSAPVIPGLAELTGTWVNSVASANGDPALIHIFANGNYESSGSCDLDGSTGMEYGTVSSSGSVTNIIAFAQLATQGSCGPSQGNKTLTVNGDVLTLSEPGFADIVYNRLVGTLNPIVGSWLLGNIQDPGEAHTILTMLDDTTFTLSQDCTTESVSGFEYGDYAVDQSNNLTGTLTIDSNGGCGLHNNTALSISGFTMTVVGDTLTLTDTVGGGMVFTFARISPAYVIPMLQVVYILDNVMMQPGDGQITGSFTWSYVDGDFVGGSGQFTDLTIPNYGSDIAGLNINFDSEVGIEITLLVNTNNNGVDIIFNFLQPLSPTAGTGINLGTSSYNIEIGALQGAFVSGAFTPQRGDWWQPTPGTTWQWQLQGTINQSYDVDMYDIDLYDTSVATINSLKNSGKVVICYFSGGSYEEWRDDANDFNASDRGNPLDNWPGEAWLDIRSTNVRAVMEARLDLAVTKGCDGVEPDNMDGYTNNPGFPLTAADQIDYNIFMAEAAHDRGLSVGLKNNVDQIPDLVDYYDFAVNEECFQYNECGTMKPFTDANKAVFNAEYGVNSASARAALCADSIALELSTLVLDLELDDSVRYSCL